MQILVCRKCADDEMRRLRSVAIVNVRNGHEQTEGAGGLEGLAKIGRNFVGVRLPLNNPAVACNARLALWVSASMRLSGIL